MTHATTTHGTAKVVPEPEPAGYEAVLMLYLEEQRRRVLAELHSVERALERLKALQVAQK